MLLDEIEGFAPIVINGNLDLINDLSKEEQTQKSPAIQRLSGCDYRPPVSFEVIPDSKMYDLEQAIQRDLNYLEGCRARGRVKAGEHIAGGGLPNN